MEWMDIVPFTLIFGGFIATFWLFEKILSPEKNTLERIDRFFTRFLGPLLGFFMLILSGLTLEDADWFTSALLVFIGLALCLNSIKDIPLAATIALMAGCAVAGVIYLLIGTTNATILGIVFIIIFIFVFLSLKLAETLLKLFAAILTFPIIALIIGLLGIIQGILILADSSLITIF
jgi:hypothetical protein